VSHFTRIRAVRDELATVGDKSDDDELLRTALNKFSKQWDVFAQVING